MTLLSFPCYTEARMGTIPSAKLTCSLDVFIFMVLSLLILKSICTIEQPNILLFAGYYIGSSIFNRMMTIHMYQQLYSLCPTNMLKVCQNFDVSRH
jgi:hypothetical protein